MRWAMELVSLKRPQTSASQAHRHDDAAVDHQPHGSVAGPRAPDRRDDVRQRPAICHAPPLDRHRELVSFEEVDQLSLVDRVLRPNLSGSELPLAKSSVGSSQGSCQSGERPRAL